MLPVLCDLKQIALLLWAPCLNTYLSRVCSRLGYN